MAQYIVSGVVKDNGDIAQGTGFTVEKPKRHRNFGMYRIKFSPALPSGTPVVVATAMSRTVTSPEIAGSDCVISVSDVTNKGFTVWSNDVGHLETLESAPAKDKVSHTGGPGWIDQDSDFSFVAILDTAS